MGKERIIVNDYDNTHSVRKKYTKINPKRVVTKVKMFPVIKGTTGRGALVTFKQRVKTKLKGGSK